MIKRSLSSCGKSTFHNKKTEEIMVTQLSLRVPTRGDSGLRSSHSASPVDTLVSLLQLPWDDARQREEVIIPRKVALPESLIGFVDDLLYEAERSLAILHGFSILSERSLLVKRTRQISPRNHEQLAFSYFAGGMVTEELLRKELGIIRNAGKRFRKMMPEIWLSDEAGVDSSLSTMRRNDEELNIHLRKITAGGRQRLTTIFLEL